MACMHSSCAWARATMRQEISMCHAAPNIAGVEVSRRSTLTALIRRTFAHRMCLPQGWLCCLGPGAAEDFAELLVRTSLCPQCDAKTAWPQSTSKSSCDSLPRPSGAHVCNNAKIDILDGISSSAVNAGVTNNLMSKEVMCWVESLPQLRLFGLRALHFP
ncbi:hypothetical protein PYCCODRAFT_710961 [Trametes coccinea BRFM310]|uniref:Uncharacterized protein n=1 Tax=Trametes coccinea (strain BRFM310) TaxID=1353009 RepID=A0A1Y2IGF9_TRAC3|nr:hypothetical protein PYCCODRAFT_710961 [Trametes coccinea BRFM310]